MKTYNIISIMYLLHVAKGKGSGRINELNVSREPPSPLAFWPFKTDLHHSTQLPGKRYAILEDTTIDLPGPSGSYGYITVDTDRSARIPNSDGYLDGTDAMTWMMYIRTTSTASSVLLQYAASANQPGFTLGISQGRLWVSCRNGAGTGYSYQSSFSVSTNNQWIFIGVSFNMLWVKSDHLDLLDLTSKVVRSTHSMSTAVETVDAHGDIKIGRAWADSEAFDGDIACVQFFNTSLLGGTLEDTKDLCNPYLGEFPGDNTFEEATYVTTTLAPCSHQSQWCELSEWGAWEDCTLTCGGGVRKRTKDICCPVDKSWNDCRQYTCNINIEEVKEFKSCNTLCHNGGTYDQGCVCPPQFTDPCCDTDVKCYSDPPIPNHARLVVQGYYYNNQSAIVCDHGYALTSGDAIRHCNSSGEWNGTAPICSLTNWHYEPHDGYGEFSFLKLDKSGLSKQRRLHYSVYEDRQSKVLLGTVGIVVMALFVGYFLLLDCLTMLRQKNQ